MPSTAITFGILLILVGLGGFAYAAAFMLQPGDGLGKYWTALIPAIFGILLAGLGYLAKTKENLRKHIMHVAVVIGLIGFLATVSSVFKIPSLFDGTAARPLAVVAQFLTAIICLAFVGLCVKSFIDARRSGVV